ncbi:multicopper oxidase family protein [Acidimicrobiia bacterium EGI L10123]|uniref:multicopper oxidase family protein n=1 Tax=Salinilacustrithrix flava TaxID=2957203 RepID=UPI003D7C2391|nr:multicopper oxidase family protein [Acidimicrobiia bacterium EGI L10123]
MERDDPRQAPSAHAWWSRAPLDRRAALGVLGAAGVAGLLAACSGDDPPTSAPPSTTTAGGPGPLAPQGMPELEPEMRDLHLRLVAAPATATIVAGTETEVLSFRAEVLDGDPASVTSSGSYLGPTLHLRTGQRVRVDFDNEIDQDCIVHWHGLVLPQGQDGQPPEAVGPGERYEYDFTVPNEPGTYWYHSHTDMLTGEQVYRGLAGLLIVHGDEPGLPSRDNDFALVLQDRTIDADGTLRYAASMHDLMAGFVGSTLVTNGVAELALRVRREPYRIRLLNGANSRLQRLTWSTGEPLHAVATDGELLPETVDVPGLVLAPAQRTDLWMDFSGHEPGDRIELRAADLFVEAPGMGPGRGPGRGGGTPMLDPVEGVAVTFVVDDSPAEPGEVPARPGGSVAVHAADAVNADAPKQFVLSTFRASHWINDTQWAGREVTETETVAFGTTEVWEFVSRSPLTHPMHLHGQAFRVVERTWEDDGAAAAWEQIADGVVESGLRDTVVVWPGQRVRIVVPFDAHRGYFLYHCHILEHEDHGMMRSFLIE